jgi:hypothetical protein
LTIEEIRKNCQDNRIEVTSHILLRFQQRNISYDEIKEVIMSGEIIEEYPNDYPYPSCLLLGYTSNNRVIHIVVGMSETKLWLITAYQPNPEQWSADFKVRKD